MSYLIHFCKKKDCNNAWIDLDLTNAKNRPPRWKYCADCCKKFGYVNPIQPPKRKNYYDRLERIKKYNFNAKKIKENEFKLIA